MFRGRKQKTAVLWTLLATMLLVGCRPMQPYYLREDGDLSHYLDTATKIDYPDVETCSLDEVTQANEPVTIRTVDPDAPKWDLTLEEAIQTALANSKIVRGVPVRQFGQFVNQSPERLTLAPDGSSSIYDVAIQESGQSGVEQILSNFDAVFNSQATWESFDRPQNVNRNNGSLTPLVLQQDAVTITNELSKLSASGAQLFMRNTNTYTGANNLDTSQTRAVNSDWLTTVETEIRQPLARNRGTQINRIPVVLARMRTDGTLAQFELSVMELINNVEHAYWDLFFFYHNFQSATVGRDSALGIWRRVNAKYQAGAPGGEAEQEAQAREQYFRFRARAEEQLHGVLRMEARLRFLMGLTTSDGRLIRPIDNPTVAQLTFDWQMISREAIMRNPALRQQRWRIKQRELELIAARNQLLPRIDAVALYRWVGIGDEFNHWNNTGIDFPNEGSSAVDGLFSGNHQEFRMGFEAEIPIGFRQPLAQVRNQQLLLVREKSRLEEQELEVIHQLDDVVKQMDAQYQLVQTNLDALAAAETQVRAVEAAFPAGVVVLDLLLTAQQRRADAETSYYQALTQYNEAIALLHLRKGSVLDYNNVVLAEGPWPAKAYFDAQNLARQRDASYCLHYGYSRPNVVSRGPVENNVPASTQPSAYTGNPYPTGSATTLEPKPAEDDADGAERIPGPDGEEDSLLPPPMDNDERGDDGRLNLDPDDNELAPPPPIEDENTLEAYRPQRFGQTSKRCRPRGNTVRFTDKTDLATQNQRAEQIPTSARTSSSATVPANFQSESYDSTGSNWKATDDEAPDPIQIKFK